MRDISVRMARRLRALLLIVAALCGLAAPAGAGLIEHKTELPEWFRKQLHSWDDYQILIIKGSNPSADVDRLVATPEAYRIVAWQVRPEATREADVKRVLTWVSQGGTLFFQDSRLGPMFGGFENAPIGGTDLPPQGFKPTHGAYGDVKKAEGANMFGVVNPGGGHPVLAGVDYVQLFALKVGDAPGQNGAPGGLYSAVRRAPDVIPLLRYDPTSNTPVSDRLAAAMKPLGDGHIVFKPLIWEEQYTGGRFQYNLLEWSSGFGVPDMTAAGKSGRAPRRPSQTAASGEAAADPSLDQVTRIDKRVLQGTILTKDLKLTVFEPLISSSRIAFDQVRAIAMQANGMRDTITLVDGRRLFGSVSFPDDLSIRGASGQVTRIKKSEILRITVHETPASPQLLDKKER